MALLLRKFVKWCPSSIISLAITAVILTDTLFFVNLTPWTKEFLPENIQKLYENPAVAYYGEGGFEEEFYVVKPQIGDTIITKNTYDAFTNPELESYLKENGIRLLPQ
jgi:nicotinamidase-related amidase